MTPTTTRAAIELDPADGGRLASLRVDGRELLGGSTPPPGMPPAIFWGSFVMAPWVGRLAGGRFRFDGRSYEVPLNTPDTAIHGLAFDRAWEHDGDDLVLELDERWPFGGVVRQSFDLRDDGLTVTATISNDARRMPAILGFHPWFAREAGGDPLEHRVEPGARYVTDRAGAPTGELDRSGGGRPWDDSFSGMLSAPVLRWGELEVTVEVTSTEWIVCETMPGGVCVEPISGPVGGLASGRFAVVEPGRPHTLELQLTWSTPSQNKET